jgi:hypothetical protein
MGGDLILRASTIITMEDVQPTADALMRSRCSLPSLCLVGFPGDKQSESMSPIPFCCERRPRPPSLPFYWLTGRTARSQGSWESLNISESSTPVLSEFVLGFRVFG